MSTLSSITVSNLGKSYRVDHLDTRGGYKTLRDMLSDSSRSAWNKMRGGEGSKLAEEFWALKDVNFDVRPGEVVGVIGRNGAGKSTLLKILSRITKPTTGAVELKGRIGSLLEVGTGFHPELTGRENIFLNGAILNMARSEIVSKFDEIVEFAGVQKFLDTPVKRYSSGMYVRLAFAVAASLETEILLVDEVLAVGDAEFQKKCLGRMHSLSESGRTVFFVSHSMPAVRSLTDRCLYLQNGQMAFDGSTQDAITRYLNDAWIQSAASQDSDVRKYRRDPGNNSPVRITRLKIKDLEGNETNNITSQHAFTIECEIESTTYSGGVVVSYWLSNQHGERIVTCHSIDQGFGIALKPGRVVISSTVQDLPLSPGKCNLTIGVNQSSSTTAFDVLVDYPAFTVQLPGLDSGAYDWTHRPWGGVHWSNIHWSSSRDEQ